MAGCDAFITRCREQFAFLEEHGLEPGSPGELSPQECSQAWTGAAGSVTVITEFFEPPDVYLRPAVAEHGFGLQRVRAWLDPGRAPPDEDDPLLWVDFWAAFLQDHLHEVLYEPGPIVAHLDATRSRREEAWCGAFFDAARPAFAFLVHDHDFDAPLPATDPQQCSLNYLASPRSVLVYRHQGEPPAVSIDPGPTGDRFGLGDAAAVLGLPTELPEGLDRLAVLARLLREHPQILHPDEALLEGIRERWRARRG